MVRTCGDLIRKLKSEKADKGTVDAEVKVLLALKELYKEKAGKDWKPDAGTAAAKSKDAAPKKEEQTKAPG